MSGGEWLERQIAEAHGWGGSSPAPAPTELETFRSWLRREGIKFHEEPEWDDGVDVVVTDTQHTRAIVTFRNDGTFSYITS